MDQLSTLTHCTNAHEGNIQFKDIAQFQMIESATIPIIVALEEEAIEWVNRLEYVEHAGGLLRRLQKFVVQVYPYQFEDLKRWLEEAIPGIWVLRTDSLYSSQTGLQCSPPQGNALFG